MAQERSERVRQLVAEALELPASERRAFLVQRCGPDRQLLQHMELLLAESSTMTTIGGVRLRDGSQRNPGNAAEVDCDASFIGRRLKGRYLLQRELGRGGFGVVHLATDEQLLSKRVVVKIMLNAAPDAWERRKFRNEIEALAKLNHPNIVSVYDLGETDDGRPFLVMEYVDGISLRSLMRREGMDLDRTAAIIRQIGSALESAHGCGIWHRDLKPENIIVQILADGDERIKLIDFGLASVASSEQLTQATTRIAGTFRYMAPEQFTGKPSAASDIYSLGVITYEMVTGRNPFNAETSIQMYAMQIAGVQVGPKSLRPSLPNEAERSILRALQPVESGRHSSVTGFVLEFVQAIRSANRGASLPNRAPEPHLGRLVSKMCDRRSQEDEFRNFLRQTAGREAGPPVLCLIHGDEGECHESLVERLAYHAELLAGKRESREGVAVKVIKIPWQHEGTVEIRLGRLIGWLFERVGTGPGFRFDDTSPAALAGLLASSHSPFVFLQHDIRAARWDDLTKSLIQSYRGYLSELPIGPAGPGVIVCLNIIYPKNPSDHVSRFGFDPRSFVYKRKKARVCRELSEIAAIGARGSKSTICPCLLLDELKPIHRDDVLEWFSFHNILETEEQRLNAAKRIFGNSRAMPDYMRMAEIETHLREVQHAFLVERGFL